MKTMATYLIGALTLFNFAFNARAEDQPRQQNIIGAAKLIVKDLQKAQKFYEAMFGMKEVRHVDYNLDVFEESIMGFANTTPTLALFAPNPKAEAPLNNSEFPVVLIYSPELDAVAERLTNAGYGVERLGLGSFRIVITRDPSGNAVEIFGRPGEYEVGGSKLIVNNKAKAQAFYEAVFNAKPGETYASPNVYDEVLMRFGSGPFLALFQPLAEPEIPKSRFPVTAFYTAEFDAVIKRLDQQGLGYRMIETPNNSRIVIARDPAGNAIEIIDNPARVNK